MKQMLKIFYLCIFCLLIGVEGLLFSQTPAPKNLRAKPTDDNRILLEWEKPDIFKVTSYQVYRSAEDDTIGFMFIASVPGEMQSYLDYNLQKGKKYNYYISAVAGLEGSGKSNMATALAVPGAGYIAFTSKPIIQAQVGQYYYYKIAAGSTNSNTKIEYSLINKHKDMVLEYNAGWEIQWKPEAAGRYDVAIEAKYQDSAYIQYGITTKTIQKFTIQVAAKVGNIKGQVVDEFGIYISNVTLKFYEATNSEFSYETTTDGLGNYYLNKASSGRYYVYLKAPDGYISTWYPNSPEMKTGELIKIPEVSEPLTQVFTIQREKITTAYIKGIVKDTFENPIGNASIIVVDAKDYLNIGKDDKSLDVFIDEIRNEYSFYSSLSDVTGQYQILVPKGKQYIVFCQSNAYPTVYYPNVSSLLDAVKINMDVNKNGIDFYLLPKKSTQNRIDGKVIRSDVNLGIESRVIMINKQAPRGPQGGGRVPYKFASPHYLTLKTDRTGTFIMENIDTSKYYLQAIPMGSFLPSYFAPSYENGTIKWKEADSVNMTGAVTGLVIKTIPSISDGVGSISGNVKYYDTQFTNKGIGGAIVYALTDGIPVGYGITDTLGNYIIKGLRSGDYTLYVDKIDYKINSSQTINISFPYINKENVDLQLLANSQSPTNDVDAPYAIPAGYSLMQNYPNPFNPSTSIKYQIAERSMVEIRVYDILGREAAILQKGMREAGGYDVTFNANNLSTGVYFVTLRVEQGSRTVYFDKRKMLLIK